MSIRNKLFLLLLMGMLIISLIFTFLSQIEPVNRAYITNQGENTVSVVDLNTLSVDQRIAVGSSPLGGARIPSKKLAVIGNVNSKNLSIINLDKNKVVSTIPLDTAPLGIVANASGDKVFITSWFKRISNNEPTYCCW